MFRRPTPRRTLGAFFDFVVTAETKKGESGRMGLASVQVQHDSARAARDGRNPQTGAAGTALQGVDCQRSSRRAPHVEAGPQRQEEEVT